MIGRFSIVRKGYAPEEVDDYLEEMRDQISLLESDQRENREEIDNLKKSLNDYRQKEASINNALINSQISADLILQNARTAADNIVKNAKNEAEMTKDAVNRLLSDIVVSMLPHRKMMKEFRRDYKKFVGTYLKEIDDEKFDTIVEKIDTLEKHVEELTSDEQAK